METRVSLKYFVNDFSGNIFYFYLTIEHFQLNFFDNFVYSKAFHAVFT